jgi:hypothetical protein
MKLPDASPTIATRAVWIAGDNDLSHAVARELATAAVKLVGSGDAFDSVVCCVSVRPGSYQALADVDLAAFKADINASLRTAFTVSRQALCGLAERRGSLVYCVARDDEICLQAVQTLMRSIVYQYGPQGVRANLVQVGDDVQAAVALVRFLVSADASFMNGASV